MPVGKATSVFPVDGARGEGGAKDKDGMEQLHARPCESSSARDGGVRIWYHGTTCKAGAHVHRVLKACVPGLCGPSKEGGMGTDTCH